MRILLLFVFMNGFQLLAQQSDESCKTADEIALMEQRAIIGRTGMNHLIETMAASNNYDVKYYRCEWEMDPAIRYINGKVTIYFTMLSSSNNIELDLMNPLIVDSVKQRNTVLTRQHINNVLTVNFSNSINVGVLDSVTVFYKGVPPNTGFGSFNLQPHAGVPALWSLSEPYGSRDWWPCKNGIVDKADSLDVYLTMPAIYKGASNGMLQSELLVAGGTKKTMHWKHRYPIATYLICFAITNYVEFNNTVMLGTVNLPMQTFCYPESLASFQAGTQNTLDALVLFSNTFGEYPFIKEKYGHVQFGWGGGMEHQTSSFMVSLNESLVAHELAHQWFGDKITCGSWEDIWLNEGFATQLAAFYMENKYPANTLSARRSVLNNITAVPNGSVWVPDTTSVGRIFSGRYSYNKGSYLLYMLRWILNDEVFFKAIRNYLKDPKLAYGFARTEDLKKHLEQESGRNLTEFFKDWFKGEGFPSYQVQWSQIGANHVKIKMNQITSDASVNFFEMPVALKFKNATQEKTVVVDNKFNGEEFIKNIGFIADTVLVDPELWLITKNNTTLKVPDLTTSQNNILVFPNPIGNQFYIYLRNMVAPDASINLYNAVGQLLYSKKLQLINGSEYVEVPSQQLASGVYFLKLRSGNEVKYIKKLLKL